MDAMNSSIVSLQEYHDSNYAGSAERHTLEIVQECDIYDISSYQLSQLV